MLNRGKFNVLMANKIDPLLDGNKYMDRSERELELKQILGDILSAKRIGNEDVVLLGREGLLYAGAESKNCEALLVNFSFLLAKEQFVRNFLWTKRIFPEIYQFKKHYLDNSWLCLDSIECK